MTSKDSMKAARELRWAEIDRISRKPRAKGLKAAFHRAERLEKAAWLAGGARPGAFSNRADALYKALNRQFRTKNPRGGLTAHRARRRVVALATAQRRRMDGRFAGIGKIALLATAQRRPRRIARASLTARRLELASAIGRLERVGAEFPRTPAAVARARRLRALQRAYDRRVRVNPRKGSAMAKRKRNRLGHFIKAAGRHVRRARDRFGHFISATKKRRRTTKRRTTPKRRKNPGLRLLTITPGGTVMPRALVANPRRKRRKSRRARSTSGRFLKRRRTTRNPRRRRSVRRRRNPGMAAGFVKSAMGSLLPMGLGGIGGALSGFADAKFMADKPVVSAISKVLLGAAGAAVLRKRPAMAFGWAGGVMGSFGYSMGVKAAGGLVATSPKAALQGIADMAADDPDMAALLEGLGELTTDDGMGDSEGSADYVDALADADDDMGDVIDAE